MSHPIGFSDSDNIIIIDNIPYFCCTGLTYKDRVKNGLSLVYVFQMEDTYPIINNEYNKDVKSNETRINQELIDYEQNYKFYEKKENQIKKLTRKGKWLPFKKRQVINRKKNNIKSNGYNDKLFDIEQNLPELCSKSEIEMIYEDDITWATCENYDDYYDYYYNPSEDYLSD